MMDKYKYCNSLAKYSRRISSEVTIGDIPLGANNPIRIQSMTTTNTMDTKATVNQSIRMIDAGCEYVRITAPSRREANNLYEIKNMLVRKGYKTPLIADIHFTPNAAEIAARIVEKVRINPGNFADKKKFNFIEYSDQDYQDEIDRIYDRFSPLVKVCKEYGTAMRIGTNHGSLSDRILSRYGDTPLGMVESAMEFLRICEDHKYFNLVLSMKSSNPIIMVQAYRLLVNKMDLEGMNYPLHLGVTEAGDGEDGRIKSALGIGTLLDDGLGDTIRVSLTEDPEFELPVAKLLVSYYEGEIVDKNIGSKNIDFNPFEYNRRPSKSILNIGCENVPRIIIDLSDNKINNENCLKRISYNYDSKNDKWDIGDLACDYIYIGKHNIEFSLPGTIGVIQDYEKWEDKDQFYPIIDKGIYLSNLKLHSKLNFLSIEINDLCDQLISKVKDDPTIVLIARSDRKHSRRHLRELFFILRHKECSAPVIISNTYNNKEEEFQVYASIDVGGLLLDGMGDGVFFRSNMISHEVVNKKSFSILQATRTRISKTEYISCPSCGRTLFDLQETTARIRSKTEHLKGIKIGIMGCIVNGPGEMADADYGYVGTGVDKITLYRGQEPVITNISSNEADTALIDLIKSDGNWVEPI